MLTELSAWWVRQMAELFGDLAGSAARGRRALVIEALGVPHTVAIFRRHGHREKALGRYTLDQTGLVGMRRLRATRAGTVVLRLPPHLLLEQEVTLPLLAERAPKRVLGYEMDRLTPFSPDEVFWSWSIERRDREAGRLHVRLSLVPRVDVEPVTAALRTIGLTPTVLEIETPGSTPRRIGLQQPAARRRGNQMAALATCCGALAAVAIIQPFVLQSYALSRTARRLAELRPAVAQVETLRRRAAEQSAGTDIIAAERARVGDVIIALATVTDILPDDAFLTAFTLTQRKLTLTGEAAAAARLIAALAADPTVRNPAFVAPVTRDARDYTDLFSIRAELAP